MTADVDPPSAVCVAWGRLKARTSEHASCPVIVTDPSQVRPARRKTLGKLPALCQCECLGCQRAWWDQDKPMRKGAKIVTASGKVIAE